MRELTPEEAEKFRAAHDKTVLYHTALEFWQAKFREYEASGFRPGILALEGEVTVTGFPGDSWIARFPSDEEAERVLIVAGFKREPGAIARFSLPDRKP